MNNNDYKNKLLNLSDYEKYEYILNIKSEKIKCSLLNTLNSDDLKIKIIISFKNKDFIIEGLEFLESNYSKSLVLINSDNDNLKYELLCFINNNKFRINVINSIKDVSIKLEAMKLLNNDQEKLEIIDKVDDESKKGLLLSTLEEDKSKIMVLSSLSSDKIKMDELNKIDKYYDIFKSFFKNGLFNYLCRFNNQILTNIFDTIQVNILNKYSEIINDDIKDIYSNYVICNYNKINLHNLDYLTEIIIRLYTTNSNELQSYGNLIIDRLIDCDYPIEKFDIIEKIFIKKIPYIFKIYQLFDFLYFDNDKGILQIDNIVCEKNNLFELLADIIFSSNKKHIDEFIDFIRMGDSLLIAINNKTLFVDDLNEDNNVIFNEYFNLIKQILLDEINIEFNRIDWLINKLFPTKSFNTLNSLKVYYINKFNDTDSDNRTLTNDLIDNLDKYNNIGILNLDTFRRFLLYGNAFKFFYSEDNNDLYNQFIYVSNLDSDTRLFDKFNEYYNKFGNNDTLGIIFKDNINELNIDNKLIMAGFSVCNIKCIIANSCFEEIGLFIARNGIYIPVINNRGGVIFTQNDYDRLRKQMIGSSYLSEEKYIFSNNLINADIEKLLDQVFINKNNIIKQKEYIYSVFEEILMPFGLKINRFLSGDLSNNVVDIVETGSTSRGTSISNKLDFDFVISFGKNILFDQVKLNDVRNKILDKFKISNHSYIKEYGDLRLKDAYLYDNIYADIDVTFIMKTDNILYSADMYVEDVLNTIYMQDESKYRYVIANILLAKKVLKENGIYKSKLAEIPEWGLGGIGVECWILQNGGSFVDAIKSFLEYSKNKDFYEFKKVYYVWCFGESFLADRNINYKNEDFLYQNFIKRNMGEIGYYKMINVLKDYILKCDMSGDDDV